MLEHRLPRSSTTHQADEEVEEYRQLLGGGSCRCFNVSRTAGSHVLKSCFGTVIRKKCKVSATELEPVGRQGRFSERELTFTFAICYRPSVCRLSVCDARAPY